MLGIHKSVLRSKDLAVRNRIIRDHFINEFILTESGYTDVFVFIKEALDKNVNYHTILKRGIKEITAKKFSLTRSRIDNIFRTCIRVEYKRYYIYLKTGNI